MSPKTPMLFQCKTPKIIAEIRIAHLYPVFFIRIYSSTPLQSNSSNSTDFNTDQIPVTIKVAFRFGFKTNCSLANIIFIRKPVEQQKAVIINRIEEYFNLLLVGLNPKTDKFLFSNSQTSNHESSSRPIISTISLFMF